MSSKRRGELLDWVRGEEGRYILEDDFDSEFRFQGQPLPPIRQQDTEHVIYMNTFSKTLSPAFRIGYVVLPPRLMSAFSEHFSFLSCTAPSLDQAALASFIEKGHYARHLLRMKNYYKNLRDELLSKIQSSPLYDLASIRELSSGLHFLLSCRAQLDRDKDCRLSSSIERNGILLSPLSSFFLPCTQPKSEFLAAIDADAAFVVNYSGVEKQSIKELTSRLTSSFQSIL